MPTAPSPHTGGTSPPQPEMATTTVARSGPPRQGEHSPAPRRPASAVPSIRGLLISPPGSSATLVDISASGLLAECGVPLRIAQAVTVNFEGTFAPQSVEAQVVRSSVASMTSAGVRYHVGFAFTAPIAFEDKSPPETGAENGPAPAALADPPPPSALVNRW